MHCGTSWILYGCARAKSNAVMEARAAELEAAPALVVSPLSCWQTLKMLKSFKPTSSGSGKGRKNSEGAESISFHDNPCLQASSKLGYSRIWLMPCPFTGSNMFCDSQNFWASPKSLSAFSASSKTFVPSQKPILLNTNHLFVCHKMFATVTIRK